MTLKRGFTLIEVAVAVAIIGVLATLTLVTFNAQQAKARDSARASKVSIISSALEHYYENNGEYPSVRAMVNSYAGNTGDAVASLLSITEKSVLVMPKASSGTTNSIATTAGTNDQIAYVAQSTIGNDNCQSSLTGGCDQWTLSYVEESTGNTITTNSVQSNRIFDPNTPLQAPTKPTLTVAQSGTNMVATSSVPSCITGSGTSPRYSFRSQVSGGAWSTWTAWQTGNTYSRGSNTNGVVYGFQVHVRCESSTLMSDTSTDSSTASATYYTIPTAPGTPTLTIGLSGSNILTTITSTATCDYGSAQYRIDYRTNDGTWTTGSWGTGLTYTTAASDGVKYGSRATARCVNGTQNTAGTTSSEVTYVDPISTPSAPTQTTAATSSTTAWTWTPSACSAGTSPRYQYQFSYWNGTSWLPATSWIATSGTTATNAAATSQGIRYGINIDQQCYNSYTTSGWSSSASTTSFWVPVVHVSVQYAALALLSGAYPSIKLKSFSGPCASGLDRYVAIAADYGNTNTYTYRVLINQSTGASYAAGSFAPAPDGVVYKITSTAVASGSYVEFDIRSHCQNSLTGYGTDSGGYGTAESLYDYGNLHLITSTSYSRRLCMYSRKS